MPIQPVATSQPFTTETLSFLRELKKNNNRDWFNAHKSTYELSIKAPLLAFAAALGEKIATLDPAYATAPEKAVQRIYRDIRFSANKTPYRTELAVLFTHRALGKKAGSGLYIAISPETVSIDGGLYQQDTAGLHATRQYLMEHENAFRKLLTGKKLQEYFGQLQGAELKRPPRGFPPDHPAADLLKRTQWLLEGKMPAESVVEASFLPDLFVRIKALMPFVQFFENPLISKQKKIILE